MITNATIKLDSNKFKEEMNQLETDKKSILDLMEQIDAEVVNMTKNGLYAPEAETLKANMNSKITALVNATTTVKNDTEKAFTASYENIVNASRVNASNVPE